MHTHRTGRRAAAGGVIIASLFLAFELHAQQLAVVRVGDGTTPLSTASAPAFIDEFTATGMPIATIALPTVAGPGGAPLTMTGNATSEGHLRLSTNGRFLTFAGYATAPGFASVATSSSAAVSRVVGRLSFTGAVDTTTVLPGTYSGGNIRGAASDDGTRFWTTGTASANGGVELVPFGAGTTPQMLSAAPTNTRVPGIFGGQLFMSSASGTFVGVNSVGTGLPTTLGQTVTLLPGFGAITGGSPYSFVALDMNPAVAGLDRLYVADDRQNGAGGIQRWVFDGTTWTLSTTFSTGPTNGMRGLTASVSGGNVVLYATTSETTANTVVTATDDGVATSVTFTVLATAPANTAFRGIDFMPTAPPPVPATAAPALWILTALVLLVGVLGISRARRKGRGA